MVPAEEEGFRVTDRRRRVEEDESPAPEPAALRPEPPRAEPPRVEIHRAAAPRSAPEPAPAERAPERDLTGLFIMLASSAAMALGEAADPQTGEVPRDLGQAAELIDLLLLLREKTEGNRSPEETQVLEELMYDLQLRYVAATKRSGSRPGPSRA